MLMAIKVKEVAVYPLVEITMAVPQDKEDKLLQEPKLYWYHLSMLLTTSRIGRNILQEFIAREFTAEGIDWVANQLLHKDKLLHKKIDEAVAKAEVPDMQGRL